MASMCNNLHHEREKVPGKGLAWWCLLWLCVRGGRWRGTDYAVAIISPHMHVDGSIPGQPKAHFGSGVPDRFGHHRGRIMGIGIFIIVYRPFGWNRIRFLQKVHKILTVAAEGVAGKLVESLQLAG